MSRRTFDIVYILVLAILIISIFFLIKDLILPINMWKLLK